MTTHIPIINLNSSDDEIIEVPDSPATIIKELNDNSDEYEFKRVDGCNDNANASEKEEQGRSSSSSNLFKNACTEPFLQFLDDCDMDKILEETLSTTYIPFISLDSSDEDTRDEGTSKVQDSHDAAKTTNELPEEAMESTEHEKSASSSVVHEDVLSSNISKRKRNEDTNEDGVNDGADVNKETENPITDYVAKLIDVCRQADSSSDMDRIIKKKLLKYYHLVHSDFINSESFRKLVSSKTQEIQSNPKCVFWKLSSVLEELDVQRKSVPSIMTKQLESEGDLRREKQIERLNKALCDLKKRISKLETMEVSLSDEENSSFVLTERYKKRACELFEKICDLSGESKVTKKSIKFNGTKYPEFNKTIQAFVNKTDAFPDYWDVSRILEHCNSKHNLHLSKEQMKTIAQDAFCEIGRLLQKRRKTNLFQTVNFYSEGAENDPANVDAELRAKLDENRKNHSRINDVINKFVEMQNNVVINKPNEIENDLPDIILNDADTRERIELEAIATQEKSNFSTIETNKNDLPDLIFYDHVQGDVNFSTIEANKNDLPELVLYDHVQSDVKELETVIVISDDE